MTTETKTKFVPRHRILREVIRNYATLKAEVVDDWYYSICTIPDCINSKDLHASGKGHAGECDLLEISLLDLKGCLKSLSPRKKEAVFFHIILDWKQKDVAAQMGITTVSVGQYVEQAMIQAAKLVWPELSEAEIKGIASTAAQEEE